MTRSIRFYLSLAIALTCVLPARCSAQQVDINGMPIDPAERAGCPRLEALPPLPSAKVVSCQKSDSVEVSMPLKPDPNGLAQEKKARGAYQFREYQIGELEQPNAFDNLLALLPSAGFRVKYSNKPSTITARKDDTWILINVSDEFYNVSVVQEAPEVWPAVKTAEEISREMQAHNHVDIYGVGFSPTDQSILERQPPILVEVLKYLRQNAELSVVIESDKVSKEGSPEMDEEITRKRANAVMEWLVANGVAQTRVQPRPGGRNNPVTENESPSEIQRNERLVLVKAPI